MPQTSKASYKLYLLLFTTSVLLILTGSFCIREMHKMNQNTQSLEADRILPLQQLSDIRYAILSGILNTVSESENHSIGSSEAKNRLTAAEKIIHTNWKAYLNTYLTPEEAKTAGQATALVSALDNLIERLKQAFEKNSIIADKSLIEEIRSTANKLIRHTNQLSLIQIKVGNQVSGYNEATYQSSVKNIFILCLCFVLCAVAIGYFIIKDISKLVKELKASNLKIKASEEKAKAFMKYAGDAIFMLDTSLKITEVNDSACHLLDYPKDELLSGKITDVFASDGKNRMLSMLEQLNSTGSILFEWKLERKDKSIVDAEMNIRLLNSIGYIVIIRDITQRKIAESVVKDSEEKYRNLFENSPAFTIIWDLETLQVLEVNNFVLKTYGYTSEEWKTMSVLQFRPEADWDRLKHFAQARLRNEQTPVNKLPWVHLKKNGDEMLMEITSHNIIYNNRKAVLSLGRDVTEQIKSREALRKSEEIFRSLIDHAADAIFMVDINGYIFDANISASELLGYSHEELMGMNVLNLNLPEKRATIPETVWDKLKKENTLVNESILVRKDGTTVEVDISRKMLPDRSGAIAIVRDITERKKIERALISSEEKHRALVENISDGILMLDSNKEVLYQSDAIERINGYSYEERKNQSVEKYAYPDDIPAIRQYYSEAIASPGVTIPIQFRVIHKKGHIVWAEGSIINLLENESVKAFVINYRDITEKTLYEEKLARASIKAQEEERYEIGGELHDNVCQILVSAMIYLGLLKKRFPPDSFELFEETKKLIELASTEIRNLSHQLAPALFDNATLYDAFLNLLSNINIDNKYKIDVDFDQVVKTYQLSREVQLNMYRILQEQLRNIMKHAKATSIKVGVAMKGQKLHMLISDNGMGFNTKEKKSGIGFANMKRRIQLFNGSFSVHSKIGKGCKVLVEIPV